MVSGLRGGVGVRVSDVTPTDIARHQPQYPMGPPPVSHVIPESGRVADVPGGGVTGKGRKQRNLWMHFVRCMVLILEELNLPHPI